MTWFGVKVVVEGPHAEEAHAIMHEPNVNIEHHGFANFNGLNFADAGIFGLMARGSNKVKIGLHGRAAKNPQAVVDLLKKRNPAWKIRIE